MYERGFAPSTYNSLGDALRLRLKAYSLIVNASGPITIPISWSVYIAPNNTPGINDTFKYLVLIIVLSICYLYFNCVLNI